MTVQGNLEVDCLKCSLSKKLCLSGRGAGTLASWYCSGLPIAWSHVRIQPVTDSLGVMLGSFFYHLRLVAVLV